MIRRKSAGIGFTTRGFPKTVKDQTDDPAHDFSLVADTESYPPPNDTPNIKILIENSNLQGGSGTRMPDRGSCHLECINLEKIPQKWVCETCERSGGGKAHALVMSYYYIRMCA
ncbi:hypothetical protein BDZ97DRAFT_2067589 [Flammula alnicola]|nr:hypothetical protein BDZ97DRAFT_2067589 [Flammula alnicola]